jgi:hypothetical protein
VNRRRTRFTSVPAVTTEMVEESAERAATVKCPGFSGIDASTRGGDA